MVEGNWGEKLRVWGPGGRISGSGGNSGSRSMSLQVPFQFALQKSFIPIPFKLQKDMYLFRLVWEGKLSPELVSHRTMCFAVG